MDIHVTAASDLHFLRQAIELAREGIHKGEGGPFGAVVVRDGVVVGQGYNRVTGTCDPTAHAEVVAIRDACAQLQSFQLTGCTVYSSCEPCPMCLGAIYWARPKRLVYAASRSDAAQAGFDDEWLYEEIPLPPNQRQLPTDQQLRVEGQQPFQEWARLDTKIPY